MKKMILIASLLSTVTLHALPDMRQYQHEKIITDRDEETFTRIGIKIKKYHNSEIGTFYQGYDKETKLDLIFTFGDDSNDFQCCVLKDDKVIEKSNVYTWNEDKDFLKIAFDFENGRVFLFVYDSENIMACIQTKGEK